MTKNDVNPAFDQIRSHPGMYFRSGHPNAVELLQWVLNDMVNSGVGKIAMYQYESWWSVMGDSDWLEAARSGDITALFSKITPTPSQGDNTMRGEVLIGAIASDIVTATKISTLKILGSPSQSTIDSLVSYRPFEWERMVAFRMSEVSS